MDMNTERRVQGSGMVESVGTADLLVIHQPGLRAVVLLTVRSVAQDMIDI